MISNHPIPFEHYHPKQAKWLMKWFKRGRIIKLHQPYIPDSCSKTASS